jgi:hypothetical protein
MFPAPIVTVSCSVRQKMIGKELLAVSRFNADLVKIPCPLDNEDYFPLNVYIEKTSIMVPLRVKCNPCLKCPQQRIRALADMTLSLKGTRIPFHVLKECSKELSTCFHENRYVSQLWA